MKRKGEAATIHECRISGSKQIEVVLDLGLQPLANGLLQDENQEEEFFPLRIGFCQESSLVQLMETVPKETLFRNYFWVSGTAAGTREYAKTFYQRAIAATGKSGKIKVLEIASNDGTFLSPFRDAGHQVLGIDPARNIVEEANQRGIPTWAEFWNREVAQKVLQDRGNVDLVYARNVVPHVSELHEVIQGMADVLTEEGLGIIEFHEAKKICAELHYDSIYHEHLCYFSLHSMQYLLRKHGLSPFHIDFSPISGGSVVVYFSKLEKRCSNAYQNQMALEQDKGINSLEIWQSFAEKARNHRQQSLDLMQQVRGKCVVGFGASARSSTYMNFCGFSKESFQAVIDNNLRKHGLWTPGTHVPIVSVEKGLDLRPDYIFVLAWNFAEEIMQECRGKGFSGKFILPFPGDPRMLS